MRLLWLGLLATCAGCAGISIGDPGKEVPSIPTCAERTQEAVTDLTKPPHDFARAPAVWLAPANGTWQGTLDRAHGDDVPLTIEMTVDATSVRAVYPGDMSAECVPWLVAQVTLVIDAGPTLHGTARGELSTGDDTQLRVAWIDLDQFESTLEVPDFGAKIITGPALVLDFLFGGDRWHSEWQFAAQVATEPCDEKTKMCPGDPDDFTSEYREIGTLELERSEAAR